MRVVDITLEVTDDRVLVLEHFAESYNSEPLCSMSQRMARLIGSSFSIF